MEALASSAELALNFNFLSLSSTLTSPRLTPNSSFFPKIPQNRPSLAIFCNSSSFTANPSSELSFQDPDLIQEAFFSNNNGEIASNFEANSGYESSNLLGTLLFPEGFQHWLVSVDGPVDGFSSKAQAVDFCVDILSKVLGNERDSQMCLYHVSWQSEFGFCCMLDEESAQKLTVVPGVLSVHPDEHFESKTKDYGGRRSLTNAPDSAQTAEISKTKLFITGLSFYTSEKTLRSAFEPFGELVEVKVIMDKISKRSKGYAFVEYTTEAAATTALQEMNGKIINGWMIVVDRAKSKPKYSRGRPKSMPSQDRKLT